MKKPEPTPFTARPMAFLSDIHGNSRALDAVLRAVDGQVPGGFYVAGDLLLGGDAPLEVWRTLQRVHARCIRGVSDTALARVDPQDLRPVSAEEQERADAFARTRAALGELVLEQMRRLPDRLRVPLVSGGELLMVHGSPADADEAISHDAPDDELLALVADDPADLVVVGAAHVPFERHIGDLHVLGLGSVGAAPEGGVAHYAIITPRLDAIQIEKAWTEY